jgi:hypothetical protein
MLVRSKKNKAKKNIPWPAHIPFYRLSNIITGMTNDNDLSQNKQRIQA